MNVSGMLQCGNMYLQKFVIVSDGSLQVMDHM
jgi:hypothetical protein